MEKINQLSDINLEHPSSMEESVISNNGGEQESPIKYVDISYADFDESEDNTRTNDTKLSKTISLSKGSFVIFKVIENEKMTYTTMLGKGPNVNVVPFDRGRYCRYIDSSIWNTAIFHDDTEQEKQLLERLVERNKKRNLHKLNVAQEYQELHYRMLRESYLDRTLGRSGHSGEVVPFLFYSERFMRELIDEDFKCGVRDRLLKELGICGEVKKDNRKSSIFNYNWRILLVDDHVKRFMTPEEYNITKADVIKWCLEDVGFNVRVSYYNDGKFKRVAEENKTPELIVDLFCVETVDHAKYALGKYKFDIVLLDYLIKVYFKNGRPLNDAIPEYSYKILKDIKDAIKREEISKSNSYSQYKLGPNKSIFFMFISAFTTAVNERLLADGLHKSEEFWHIADGACPTNTPYLFLYNLLHLMEKRVKDMGLEKLSIPNYRENANDFDRCYIKSKIIDEIFNSGNVRQRANERFDKVLSLLYHYKNLLRDTHNPGNIFESKESVLATDFIEKNPDLGGFLEHLMQLVYLTAFGTVRQWPEMWEEYQFIKSIVGPQENIERYIFKLKNNG